MFDLILAIPDPIVLASKFTTLLPRTLQINSLDEMVVLDVDTPPKVVILDDELIDYVSIARHIRRLEQDHLMYYPLSTHHTNIILLTNDPEQYYSPLASLIDMVLLKPITPNRLDAVLRQSFELE